MFVLPFYALPKCMQNKYVCEYYKKLKKRTVSLILKRIFDVYFAIILLIILSPIIAAVYLTIKYTSKGNPIFKQTRVTQYNKQFTIYKFRTMYENTKGEYVTKKNDERITPIGKFLRKTRIDEFPQIINILKGDMTFVGTRPEVPQYVEKYTDEMMATLLLPAGITSYTSLKFKNEDKLIGNDNSKEKYISVILPRKMEYNLNYIRNFSFWYDIKIVGLTAKDFLFNKGEQDGVY